MSECFGSEMGKKRTGVVWAETETVIYHLATIKIIKGNREKFRSYKSVWHHIFLSFQNLFDVMVTSVK